MVSDIPNAHVRYRKIPKCSDIQKSAVIILNFEQWGYNIEKKSKKDAGGMANSVDPDQTS